MRTETLVDNQTINLRDGKSVYSINSDSSTGYRLKFAGSSDNPEKKHGKLKITFSSTVRN